MYFGNKLGRRKTLAVGAIINVTGTAIFASSYSYGQLVIGRLTLGIGLGMMSATVPLWQAETSRTHKRGRHVITVGMSDHHRILGALVLSFTFLFPESPRWLALGGDCDRPRAALAAVLGDEPNSEYINTMLNNIIHTNEETASSASFGLLFTMGKEKMLYRLLLACSVQWFSQMAGSALIRYYSNQLFSTIGLSSDLSKIMGASVLTFKAACKVIPIATIEMAGRRRLFMISGTGMAMCMFSLAICASQVAHSTKAGYAGIVFAFIFVIFYPIGFLGINYIFSQEIITTRYRAPAAGVSTSVHWLTAYVVSLTTPLGFTALGWKYYLIWGASAASILPVVYFFYPETTDLSIEEIDQFFIDSKSVLATPRLAEKRRKEARGRSGVVPFVEDFNTDKHEAVEVE
ncbi:hypothetical protein JCM24511_00009 [Saitozyma sp. JCM 24511]|nr:hypothetical protein JCM24511_00009 [Saitozyma sp. JCM 24511]